MNASARHRLPPRFAAALLACFALAPRADAQVPLPGGNVLPQVDLPALPGRVDDALDGALDRTARELSGLRQLQVRQLLRAQRALVDRDADGAPVLRGEVIAIAPTPGGLRPLVEAGFVLDAERTLDGIDLRIAVLRAPAGVSTRAAVRLARRLDPGGDYDYNHLFWRSSRSARVVAQAAATPASAGGNAPLRVGLVDSGVDATHPALASVAIERWGCDGAAASDAHGTAVASLLAGSAVAGARGPVALFAADVYCGREASGAASELAQALAWLARERVAVVNVSLVGPRNALVERAIAQMTARGHVIVAAVGNDGPAAPPLYPAAYAGVIGVTAVDPRQRLLPEAGRGPQVDFAAPGMGLFAAAPHRRWQQVRGTSYAAPLVARLAAGLIDAPDAAAARAIPERLGALSVEPPAAQRGRYGRGILGLGLPITEPPDAPAR